MIDVKMTRIFPRIFLWLMSVFVFFWLIYSILKIRECPSLVIKEEEANYEMYGEDKNSKLSTLAKPKPKQKRLYSYNRNLPIVFISGVQGSGLELMRIFLDNNPLIRCGKETDIIPSLVTRRKEWANSKIEKDRLEHAGMDDFIIDEAVAAFVLETILKQGKIANVLCNKDSSIFQHAKYLNKLFPNAKFLLMVRDGRSSVDSLINNGISFNGITVSSFRDSLREWNRVSTNFYNDCNELGSKKCKFVFYEQLVLQTNKTLTDVSKFLDLDALGSKNKLYKNLTEISNVKLELTDKNLLKWLKNFPNDLWPKLDSIAPVMKRLGYDTSEKSPSILIYSKLGS